MSSVTGRCTQPSCSGIIDSGYCDTCGIAPSAATTHPAMPSASDPGSVATGQVGAAGQSLSPGSTAVSGSIARSMRQSTRTGVTTALSTAAVGTARSGVTTGSVRTRRMNPLGDRSRLGVGLVTIPSAKEIDAVAAVIPNAQVSEEKRYCSTCNKPVGRGREGQPGRTKGFCPACGAAFDFAPKLGPGTVLGTQYEVVGAIAHGGMGWIYLGRDLNLSGRFVVIKGLVNAADKDLQQAVITEKGFLAEVSHPLIVEVFNFVGHEGVNYIVMEYVGGKTLNDLLKARIKANNGTYAPLPLDQAIAFIIEVLPAFTYLHNKGLLYCDFKPANLMQVGDGVKLIDLGGVRRYDDQDSALYGTVGFQAPEVPDRGASVSSDIYTIARTLAVLTFEFRGYQSTFVDTIPDPGSVPLFAQHDSYYRLLLKATAPQPEDRFQTADELRDQLIGVLREVVAAQSTDTAQRTVPSPLFSAPGVSPEPTWHDLPTLRVDPADPASEWLSGLTVTDPTERINLLLNSPVGVTVAVSVDRARALLAAGRPADAVMVGNEILAKDPWEWRGLWIQGLAALSTNDPATAVGSFNAVYGQLPGELAPKLALARACEANNDLDTAASLYEVCAQTDASYGAIGLIGLARIARAKGDSVAALRALERVASTSSLYAFAKTERAQTLFSRASSQAQDPKSHAAAVSDFHQALNEHAAAGTNPAQHSVFRVSVLRQLLEITPSGVVVSTALASASGSNATGKGGSAADLRNELEKSLRDQARAAASTEERIALVDEANAVRNRTLF
jgi:serine/threonine-protein kinase PknG